MSQKGMYRVLLETLEAREKEMASGRHSKGLGRQIFFVDVCSVRRSPFRPLYRSVGGLINLVLSSRHS